MRKLKQAENSKKFMFFPVVVNGIRKLRCRKRRKQKKNGKKK